MTKSESATQHWTELTAQAMLLLGVQDMAYVKPIVAADGSKSFAVHTADGTRIAEFADIEVAFAACRQHDLEPVSVH